MAPSPYFRDHLGQKIARNPNYTGPIPIAAHFVEDDTGGRPLGMPYGPHADPRFSPYIPEGSDGPDPYGTLPHLWRLRAPDRVSDWWDRIWGKFGSVEPVPGTHHPIPGDPLGRIPFSESEWDQLKQKSRIVRADAADPLQKMLLTFAQLAGPQAHKDFEVLLQGFLDCPVRLFSFVDQVYAHTLAAIKEDAHADLMRGRDPSEVQAREEARTRELEAQGRALGGAVIRQ